MSHRDFTEKQKADLKQILKELKYPEEKRLVKAFLDMVLQDEMGSNRQSRVLKNPDLGESSRIDHQRRFGRLILAEYLKRIRRFGLAVRVLNFNGTKAHYLRN